MNTKELRRIITMLRLGDDITEYAEMKLLVIADEAESKQLLKSRVVGRREHLIENKHDCNKYKWGDCECTDKWRRA